MRVFLGLIEIAGQYKALKRGFKALGIPCTFIDLYSHPFQYGENDNNFLVSAIQVTGKRRGKVWRFLNNLCRYTLLLWALINHDVFIFGFNTSFFKDYRDLKLLKRFGKKIIYQFHGSDSRPPFLDGSLMASDRNRTIPECIALTQKKKKIIETIEQYADVIVNTPPQGHFHQRPFVLWLRIGLPNQPTSAPSIDQIMGNSVSPSSNGQAIRILHCPSHPEAKGSQEIRRVIHHLKERGLELELVEITGQPNAVVLQELSQCDFVIDQLYADYGMPGFATEAAWFGKPVIIGGYAQPLWESIIPPEDIPPTIYCHPHKLAENIEKLVTDTPYRIHLGKRARAFVETKWHPEKIAQRYLALLSEPIPQDWLFDPNDIRYWQGCCLSEDNAKNLIAAYVREGGKEALMLEDKPELEALLLEVML